MSTSQVAIIAVLVLGGALLVWRLTAGARFFIRFGGRRLITCPETRKPAAVEVAAGRGATKAFTGSFDLELQNCSRWPERKDCGQDCLSQIQADPEGCLVWNIVNRWYSKRNCALCGNRFEKIQWQDHRPAVLDENLKTLQWTEIAPEDLPEVFATHQPVCWDCHISESFRRDHPELVTERLKH